ncbi:MAG: hypothetical protein R3A48_14565 [Polyangiales bacterium]
MTRIPVLVGALGASLAAAPSAHAQRPPWGERETAGPRPAVAQEPPRATRWPAPRRARPVRRAAVIPPPRSIDRDPDPGAGAYFQTPTARVLRYGDFAATYVSALGWVGVRYGVTRHVDVGVGVPFYFAGLSVDARVAFAQGRGVSAAWWAYATVPSRRGRARLEQPGIHLVLRGPGLGDWPRRDALGRRVTANLGLHVAQRTGLGGLWVLSHATLAVRIIDGVKALAQAVTLYEVAEERAPRAEALLGNGSPRFIPYALAGARLYTRRFSADLGALVPLSAAAPLYSEQIPVIPWIALQHTF